MLIVKTSIALALLCCLATPSWAIMSWSRTNANALPNTQQDAQNAQNACAADAQRLCPDAMPDPDAVTACMKTKRSQVSKGCAAMYKRGM